MEAAAHFSQRVLLAVERLRDQPRMGRVIPEIGDETYRELIFQNYRIVYRHLADRVVIIGVLHAAMDMERQLEQRGWRIT